jgi:hypothetical protein
MSTTLEAADHTLAGICITIARLVVVAALTGRNLDTVMFLCIGHSRGAQCRLLTSLRVVASQIAITWCNALPRAACES